MSAHSHVWLCNNSSHPLPIAPMRSKWLAQTCQMCLRSYLASLTSPRRREASAKDVGTYKLREPIKSRSTPYLVFNTCRRPSSVCVCSCFPSEPIPIQTRVLILQHPNEVRQSHARLSFVITLGHRGSTNIFMLFRCFTVS